ncbi:unnamed protein product [Trichobilharzia regenti]|nr:unnamed protein product [Trichobilharzia regenti]
MVSGDPYGFIIRDLIRLDTGAHHVPHVNPSSSAAQSTVHAPCYRPDTTTTGVPNWLKLLDRQQIAEILSYHKGIHECMDGLKSPDDYLGMCY